jgi:hypothetical protein
MIVIGAPTAPSGSITIKVMHNTHYLCFHELIKRVIILKLYHRIEIDVTNCCINTSVASQFPIVWHLYPLIPNLSKRHGASFQEKLTPLVDLSHSLKSPPPPDPLRLDITTSPLTKYMGFLSRLGIEIIADLDQGLRIQNKYVHHRCNYVGSISYQSRRIWCWMNIY